MPARRPSSSGGDHRYSFNFLSTTPSGAPSRYPVVTGMSSSYAPEWKSKFQSRGDVVCTFVCVCVRIRMYVLCVCVVIHTPHVHTYCRSHKTGFSCENQQLAPGKVPEQRSTSGVWECGGGGGV